tara:strand:- start:9904 stop:10401 length:498 start_codon:yes stop_codon:yes gene_type:complete
MDRKLGASEKLHKKFKFNWVLNKQMAIGNVPHSEDDFKKLGDFGIKSIITLCNEEEASFSERFTSLFRFERYILPDHKSSRSPKLFQLKEVLSLIKVNLEYGPIFIHCFAAVERSPLVCMAWLVKECKLSSQQALDYLMQINPGTCPLPEQIATLRELERDKNNF